MNNQTDNRRNFHRIFFDTPVTVSCKESVHSAQLADISLNGALLINTGSWKPQSGETVNIEIVLDHDGAVINMEAVISHIEADRVGLKLSHIDMDSISHLRRLVELNLGDSNMLHRDLEHLVIPDKDE